MQRVLIVGKLGQVGRDSYILEGNVGFIRLARGAGGGGNGRTRVNGSLAISLLNCLLGDGDAAAATLALILGGKS